MGIIDRVKFYIKMVTGKKKMLPEPQVKNGRDNIELDNNEDDYISPSFINELKNNVRKAVEDNNLYNIDMCMRIISDEDAYEKFSNFENNMNFFGDETQKDEYLGGIKSLSNKFQSIGFQFEPDQIKRIFNLTGVKTINRADLSKKEQEEINQLKGFLNFIANKDEFEKFVNSNDEDQMFNGDKKLTFIENFYKSFKKFNLKRDSFSDEAANRLEFITQMYYSKCQKLSYKVDTSKNIDESLEQEIIDKISKGMTSKDKATIIYTALCDKLTLDNRFYITNQDYSQEYNDAIFNKSIYDVSRENNNITSKQWAELYSYLIQKHTDIDCYVHGQSTDEKNHKYAELFFKDGNYLIADGTRIMYDGVLRTRMPDTTRAKLGIKPLGVMSLNKWINGGNDINEICKLSDKKKDVPFTNLLRQLGINETEIKLASREKDAQQRILNKVKLIEKVIKGHDNLDSYSRYMAISNLVNIGSLADESPYIKNSALHKENADGTFEYVDVVSMNIGTAEKPVFKYLYNDGNNELNEISQFDLHQRLNNGTYKLNNRKLKNIGFGIRKKVDVVDTQFIDK